MLNFLFMGNNFYLITEILLALVVGGVWLAFMLAVAVNVYTAIRHSLSAKPQMVRSKDNVPFYVKAAEE